jgi:hypothetical protein
VPPAVALINYMRSGIIWRIFSQTEIFAGFFLNIIVSEAAMGRDWELIPGLLKRFTNMCSGPNGTKKYQCTADFEN